MFKFSKHELERELETDENENPDAVINDRERLTVSEVKALKELAQWQMSGKMAGKIIVTVVLALGGLFTFIMAATEFFHKYPMGK